jgi:hypothetical protein
MKLVGNLEKALRTGKLEQAWVKYEPRDLELQLEYSSASEQRCVFGSTAANDATVAEHYVGKVKNWRGVTRDGVEVPFDSTIVKGLWDLDSAFSNWLVRRCQSLDTFLCEPGAPAAAGAREGLQGA